MFVIHLNLAKSVTKKRKNCKKFRVHTSVSLGGPIGMFDQDLQISVDLTQT